MIARTPEPPYYAVIFTSLRSDSEQDYTATAERMLELAREQPGFLGVESARGADGLGITVSYWRDEESIRTWRAQAEHREAQRRGRAEWYRAFRTRAACVERDYGLE
ncbi:antibiotic biosynthesis monooxygenase [Pseudomonas resinovorans]|uniref:Antibiotic biosynthesis monooxygenase n=1 Tax=Metapseudomonas resinovorans TaxID=53412 RepID=A0ABT4Y653_METRE|nr:antibiotic biosynthesis monooxygenase [Pseudomonas resinovorans]MDA8484045.1 antibiotic biosynthesis monooxygenase [Pseudomonas resinovorans]